MPRLEGYLCRNRGNQIEGNRFAHIVLVDWSMRVNHHWAALLARYSKTLFLIPSDIYSSRCFGSIVRSATLGCFRRRLFGAFHALLLLLSINQCRRLQITPLSTMRNHLHRSRSMTIISLNLLQQKFNPDPCQRLFRNLSMYKQV